MNHTTAQSLESDEYVTGRTQVAGAGNHRLGVSGMFVGRETELAELRAALSNASAGDGSLMLLSGEAGIGKTRTTAEFARVARAEGAQVLVGACHSSEGVPAFQPWVQIVRAWAKGRELAEITKTFGAGLASIADMVPELAGAPLDARPPPLAPDQTRFRLFDSLSTFLRNIAEFDPLVVILDDLHWADRPSLLALAHVVQDLVGARILLLGTYRHTELSRGHPLLETLGRFSSARRIQLRGLPHDEVARFVEAVTGVVPPDALAESVWHLTEGNPFFVTEVVHLLDEGDLDDPAEAIARLGVPQGVRELTGMRLSTLSDECILLLGTATVIGREFDARVLQQSSGLARTDVERELAAAVSVHLLEEIPRAPRTYAFAHTLFREMIYDDLAPGARATLHRRVGEVLESRYEESIDEHLDELAHHFFEGAGPDDSAKAIDYGLRAAIWAEDHLAYERAAAHYERVLRALEQTGPIDDGHRCDLLLMLGSAQSKSGDLVRARESHALAADVAIRAGDPERLATAALGSRAGSDVVGLLPDAHERVVRLLEEALKAQPPGDSPLKVELLGRLATELRNPWDEERRAALAREGVAMAERLGDPASLIAAIASARHAAWNADAELRLEGSDEIVRLASSTGDIVQELQGRRWRLFDLMELGRIANADQEIATYTRIAGELRQPLYLSHATQFRALRAVMSGRYDEGQQLAAQTLSVGKRAGNLLAPEVFGAQMFGVWRDLGRPDRFEAWLAQAPEQIRRHVWFRIASAMFAVEAARMNDARSTFEAIAAKNFRDIPRDGHWLPTIALLAQLCSSLDIPSRIGVLYESLLPFWRRNVVAGLPAAVYLGPVSYYLGLLAATMGRDDEALRHLEDALDTSARLGARPLLARVQAACAGLLERSGHKARASDLGSQATANVRELGMAAVAEQSAARPNGIVREEAAPADDAAIEAVLKKEGAFWTVASGNAVSRLRHSKGLVHLSALLGHPGKEFHVLELASAVEGVAVIAGARSLVGMSRAELEREGVRAITATDAGEALDAHAKAAFRRRLEELAEELEEAERFNDPMRASRAHEEMDALTDALSTSVGLGGRDRRAASNAERARVNVTRTIRSALHEIARALPPLGEHLRSSIRTGTFCSYDPPSQRLVRWQL